VGIKFRVGVLKSPQLQPRELQITASSYPQTGAAYKVILSISPHLLIFILPYLVIEFLLFLTLPHVRS